jgi:hypothetical protein
VTDDLIVFEAYVWRRWAWLPAPYTYAIHAGDGSILAAAKWFDLRPTRKLAREQVIRLVILAILAVATGSDRSGDLDGRWTLCDHAPWEVCPMHVAALVDEAERITKEEEL